MKDVSDFERVLAGQKQAGQGAPRAASGGATGATGGPLAASVDQPVALEGRARDAMLGGVLVLDGGGAVYVEGVVEWPDPLSGKRLRVAGTLRRKKLAPDPGQTADGGHIHGAAGTELVIENPRWTEIE